MGYPFLMGLITSVNAKVRQISGDVEPIDVVPKAPKIFRSVMDWAAFDQARDGAEGSRGGRGTRSAESRKQRAVETADCRARRADRVRKERKQRARSSAR